MKKSVVIILSVLVAAVVLCSVYLNIPQLSATTASEYGSYVDRYQEHTSSIILGEINSAQAAARAANKIWKNRYGIFLPLKEKPYNVAYDEANGIWFVTGTLRFSRLTEFFGGSMKGGVAYLVVQQDDGKVLAIGHD